MSLPHILLGLLDQPATGYDLKKALDQTLGHLWSVELSQIYPTLQRLEQQGYLRSRQQASAKGPDRRTYRRTATGRRHLLEWVKQDVAVMAPRVPHLAQLYFMGEARSLERTHVYLTDLLQEFEDRLRVYRALEASWFKSHPGFPDQLEPDLFHAHLTLRAGIRRAQADVAWTRECLARVEARS
jgi:DNA-binding PadR family transcriptional regulator